MRVSSGLLEACGRVEMLGDLLESCWLSCRLALILDRLVASRDRLAVARDGLWGFPTACVGAVCLLGESSLGLPGFRSSAWC